MTTPAVFPTDYYYWHRAVLQGLARIADLGTDGYNSRGLASNLGSLHTDTLRHLHDLESWGFVEPSTALWDLDRCEWFRITDAGRNLVS